MAMTLRASSLKLFVNNSLERTIMCDRDKLQINNTFLFNGDEYTQYAIMIIKQQKTETFLLWNTASSSSFEFTKQKHRKSHRIKSV